MSCYLWTLITLIIFPTKATNLAPFLSRQLAEIKPVAMPVELTPETIHHLSAEQLDRNAAAYPEMKMDLDQAKIDQAKPMLMKLPLVHRTRAQRLSSEPVEGHTLYDGPTPSSYLSDDIRQHDNTYALDEELGLDDFVFLSWGAVYPEEVSSFLAGSQFAMLVDATALLDSGCLVTPHDIASSVSDRTMTEGLEAVRPVDREQVESEYLDKIVRGCDWLEIEARRIVARSLADPTGELELTTETMGEIKYKGEIPRSRIIAVIDTHAVGEYDQYRQYIHDEVGASLKKYSWLGRHYWR